MDQKTAIDQPKGNFKMNLNFARTTNSRAPAITGSISAPENPDKMLDFSAFMQTETDKETGEVKTYYIGPVSYATTMREALGQKKEYGSHFIAIRPNQFKVFATFDDGRPNPAYEALSDENRRKEDAKPAWWAKWTRTSEQPVLDASAWDREPNRYGPWASGNTQHHLAKEQLQAAEHGQDAPPERSARRPRGRSQEAEMSR
jgi:hypothetical protein